MDWFWYIFGEIGTIFHCYYIDSSPFFLRGGYTNLQDILQQKHLQQWGLSAALGARRAGADVMLLERYGCFGGVVKLEKYNHSGVYLLRIPEGDFLSWLEEMENLRWVLHFVGVQQKMILVSETGREHDIAKVRGWGTCTDGQLVIKTIYFQNFHVDWPFRLHLSLRSFNERKRGSWKCTSAIGVAS